MRHGSVAEIIEGVDGGVLEEEAVEDGVQKERVL